MTEVASTPRGAGFALRDNDPIITQPALYTGQVFHKRFRPKVHTMRYRVFSLLVDIDQLTSLSQALWSFSYNRLNIVSVFDKDFGDPHWTTKSDTASACSPLRTWVEYELAQAGLPEKPYQVLLSCYPRVLGLAFNPLSLFYCLDQHGSVYAVVHEVHNTFGERHAYVLAATRDGSSWIEQMANKALFVSPFVHMGMNYRFRLNQPAERQVIAIHASDSDGVLLTASYVAQRHTLTSCRLQQQADYLRKRLIDL